jgi:hypothetical protein
MATWIGHIRVAEALLPHFPGLDPTTFTYGSLAPDFGKPLEDDSFYPSKEVSHWMIRPGDRSIFQDLKFYREYLMGDQVQEDNARYSFLLGYFFHLVLDGLWGCWIGQACKRDFGDMIEGMGDEAWWKMKEDWYGLDVQYAQGNRDSLFWREVMKMKDLPLYLEFQDQEVVTDQVQRIQKLNSSPPDYLAERKEFPYLSKATMDRYISDSVAFILEYYRMIQEDGIPAGVESFMELFPGERLAPYQGPLGDGSRRD